MTRGEAWGWRIGCIVGAEFGHELRHHWPVVEASLWRVLEWLSR